MQQTDQTSSIPIVDRDIQLPAAKRAVLCVQPNDDYHSALQVTLASYRTVIVPSALEAIRAKNARPFDAYVLDYWLPDWSGSSLCRDIRKSDPDAPICFFSAAQGEDQLRRGMRAGADAFVHVSQGAEVLGEALLRLLRRADVRSLNARVEEERAIQEELQRRARVAISRSELARIRAAEALERAARLRAHSAFVKAGGTRANFERWWPNTFSSAAAGYRASAPDPDDSAGA